MSSSSKKDNAELEKEQKQIKYKPEDLIDTDVEAEYKEGDKKGFRQQSNPTSTSSPRQNEAAGGGGKGGGRDSKGKDDADKKPSNDQLEKEQSQMKMKPDDLKDTDVEDEFKEGGKGFRKNEGKARL